MKGPEGTEPDRSDSDDRDGSIRTVSRVLVPHTGTERAALDVACTIAQGYDADLLLLRPMVPPRSAPREAIEQQRHEQQQSVELVATELRDAHPAVTISSLVRSGSGIDSVLSGTVAERDIDLLVLPESLERAQALPFSGWTVRDLVRATDCDVVALNGAETMMGVASILVPLAGGPHSDLAVDTAQAIQRACGSWIELFHVPTDDEFGMDRAEASNYLSSHLDRLNTAENASTWVLDSADPPDAIIEQTRYYDVTVMGAPTRGRLRRFVFGSTTDAVRARSDTPVFTVWENDVGDS